MRGWTQDLRGAVALIGRRPLFAALTAGTLALAIAANTAIFGLVEATVLQRPDFPEPDRLVVVREVGTRGQEMNTSWPTYLDWRGSGVFEALGAHVSATVTVLAGDRPRRVEGAGVSAGFFAAAGVRPLLGRLPQPAEHTMPVAVVGDRFWREELGGAQLGAAKLELEGHTFDVVAVMPPGFAFPSGAEVWVPLELFDEPSPHRSAHNYRTLGRLAPGVTLEAAARRIDALTREVAGLEEASEEDADYLPVGARVRTLQAQMARPLRQPLLLLLGAAAFVLLVASLNLASSFLARGLERQRELAVRAALGASHRRLVRQLLAEAAALAALGAAGGVALALGLGRLVLRHAPPLLAEAGLRLDGTTGAYTLLAAVASVLVAGLLPALMVTRAPALSLRGARTGGVSAGQRRTWAFLVAGQAALALLLLAGAGLLLRSFAGLLAVEPGFSAEGVGALAMDVPPSRYEDDAAVVALHGRLAEAVERSPAVAAAGLVSAVPLGRWNPTGLLTAEHGRSGDAAYRVASAGYFRALEIPLLAGRLFDERDRAGAAHAAVVDRAAAELFWPGEDPIGKRIGSGGMDSWGVEGPDGQPKEWATVVGVVGAVRQGDLAAPPEPCVYFAMAQRPVRSATLVARSRSGVGELLPVLEQTLAAVAPDVAGETYPLADVLAQARAQQRFALLLLSLFAALALLLAAIGVYGVVAYAVSRRTRELGVRMALGAAPGEARALVMRGALLPVTVGAGAGLLLAPPLARTLGALLYGVPSWDPAAWLGAGALLAAAATLASWLPSRRVLRLDPVSSLRAE